MHIFTMYMFVLLCNTMENKAERFKVELIETYIFVKRIGAALLQ